MRREIAMKRIKFFVVCIILICSQAYSEDIVLDKFYSFAFEGDDMWIGSDKGLVQWNRNEGVKKLLNEPDVFTNNRMRAIVVDHDGVKWIGADKGLIRYDDTGWTLYKNEFVPGNNLPNNTVLSLALDKNNKLWIGSSSLASYDSSKWTLYSNMALPVNAEVGLVEYNAVYNIAVDENNTVWFTTDIGLVHYRDDKLVLYNRDQGIMTYNFKSLAIDNQNRPWISCYTVDKGGSHYDYLQYFNGDIFDIKQEDDSYIQFPFSALYIGNDNEENGIWYDHNKYLAYFDGEKEVIAYFPLQNNESAWFFWDLKRDSNGTLWMIAEATYGGKCYLISFDSSTFTLHDIVLEGVSVDEIPEEIPTVSVYPNPFNPVTWISFTLSVPGHVRLTIYDTTGAAVKTLIDKRLGAGTHEKVFDGSGMANGPYFYRLEEENGGVRTGKMMLVK